MINNQASETINAITSVGPQSVIQSDDVMASADQVAALRTRAQELEQGIAVTETQLSSIQSAAVTDKKLEKEIATITQDLSDQLSVFEGLRAQIAALKPGIGSDKIVAKMQEREAFANENKEAYEKVIHLFLQETKEMIGENPERQDLLKMGFINQAKVGKEGVEFWAKQVAYWQDEMKQGIPADAVKVEIAGLYEKIFELENRVTDLFGSGKKDEQNSAKSELDDVKGKIAALRAAS